MAKAAKKAAAAPAATTDDAGEQFQQFILGQLAIIEVYHN